MGKVIPIRRARRHQILRRYSRRFVLLACLAVTFVAWTANQPDPTSKPIAIASETPSAIQGGQAWGGVGQDVRQRSFSPRNFRSVPFTVSGRVTRVRDADTIEVQGMPIRIGNLDCAESGTLAGDRATRRARQLVSGQQMICRLEGRKSYDREVGQCAFRDGRDFGSRLIEEGFCTRWRG